MSKDIASEFYNIGTWLSTKLHYHKISEFREVKKKIVSFGQVWYCDLGFNIGQEKNKMRPVIVISNNKINRTGKIIIICITDAKGKLNSRNLPAQDSWYLLYSGTNENDKMFKPGRLIPQNQNIYKFLDKDSVVQCEEIRAVSKARLDISKGCIGKIEEEDLKFIKMKLKRVFNI